MVISIIIFYYRCSHCGLSSSSCLKNEANKAKSKRFHFRVVRFMRINVALKHLLINSTHFMQDTMLWQKFISHDIVVWLCQVVYSKKKSSFLLSRVWKVKKFSWNRRQKTRKRADYETSNHCKYFLFFLSCIVLLFVKINLTAVLCRRRAQLSMKATFFPFNYNCLVTIYIFCSLSPTILFDILYERWYLCSTT